MEEEDESLGAVRIPGEGTAISLWKHGNDFTIRLKDAELMTSLMHASEDSLAELVCAKLKHLPAPTILIGGLGMGYTLAAALRSVGPEAKVIVAELIPAVVEWNRGPLAHLAGRPLEDKRVVVRVQDIALSLQTELEAYDGILLDVDNGPEGLTRDSNNWLYGEDGLAATYSALRLNGILAVWSSKPDKGFAMRLRKIGFEVQDLRVPTGSGDRADHHTIWLATRRP